MSKRKTYYDFVEMFENGELEEFVDDNGVTHYIHKETGKFYDGDGNIEEGINSIDDIIIDSEKEFFTSD